jgi:hypothetical protein
MGRVAACVNVKFLHPRVDKGGGSGWVYGISEAGLVYRDLPKVHTLVRG